MTSCIGTCLAKIATDGSAAVTKKPMKNKITKTTVNFLSLVNVEPNKSPMAIMEEFTPMLNRVIPTIRKTAPIVRFIKSNGSIGAMFVK